MSGYKLKYTCEKKFNSRCVIYEGNVPEKTDIKTDDVCNCITIEEVVEYLLKSTSNIQESLDLSKLGKSCVNYDTKDGKIQLNSVLLKFEEFMCGGKNTPSGDSNALSLDIKRLDLKCLQSVCTSEIRTLQELLQAIINRLCQTGNNNFIAY